MHPDVLRFDVRPQIHLRHEGLSALIAGRQRGVMNTRAVLHQRNRVSAGTQNAILYTLTAVKLVNTVYLSLQPAIGHLNLGVGTKRLRSTCVYLSQEKSCSI